LDGIHGGEREIIAYEFTSHHPTFKSKVLRQCSILEGVVFTGFDTRMNFDQDPESVQRKSFEMNQPQTYKGSSFLLYQKDEIYAHMQ
jgi:hypothetical protein